ncbi:aldehyde oxidase [Thecamonas trahens ATCC 50062]|uniref:Aldehyde oxidase n=1 Tax=Thecamonas trahens ATCC 50062 TaxID=461836 RepID=A0A0L0DUV2_THETB|nr:aldehyde oxidase [Thecamonas trahens ATCC 50062]KNC55293.1 aldehyde oxidase [Thecamonas trahens ATCC 50062]|eukprot:XP_013753114.1 aldehyde oxidase [Thecamonas trahens ATCC 50062]
MATTIVIKCVSCGAMLGVPPPSEQPSPLGQCPCGAVIPLNAVNSAAAASSSPPAPAAPSPTPASLPDGWEAQVDAASGRTYYIDHNTRTTSWSHPEAKPSPAAVTDVAAVAATASISFTLNGKPVTIDSPDPAMSLQTWLREVALHTDVKRMCTQGGCGACLVVLSGTNAGTGRVEHLAVNSCLHPLMAVNGWAVTTPIGIGSQTSGFHPVQLRLADNNGSQCGACSPGQVMAAYALFKANPNATELDVEMNTDGNICRCTGYFPILQAFKSLVASSAKGELTREHLTLPHEAAAASSAAAPVAVKMPATLARVAAPTAAPWFAPSTMAELFATMATNPGARLVAGNTSTGVYPYPPATFPQAIVELNGVSALHQLSLSPTELTVGAGVSLARLLAFLQEHVAASATFPALVEHLNKVANTPVRNVASWIGNLVMTHDHADFPSDVFTIFDAANARLTLATPANQAGSVVDFGTFLTTSLDGVLVTKMTVPLYGADVQFKTFKVMQRHVNCHAYVNAGFLVSLGTSSVINSARIVYGGAFLAGKSVTDAATLSGALATLVAELKPNAEPGYLAYRTALIPALFYSYYCTLLPAGSVPASLESLVTQFERGVSSHAVTFKTDPSEDPVSAPISKLSAKLQASGEAVYTDDLPPAANQLFGAFVLSTVASGKLLSIDASAALALDGVVALLTADDFPANGANAWWADLPVFTPVGADIGFHGQAIGFIVAESHELALAAAALVTGNYGPGAPPVFTIDDAVAAGRFVPGNEVPITQGDVASGFSSAQHVVEGVLEMPSQAHMTMQTQVASAAIVDGDLVQLDVATQWPAMTQTTVATALGLEHNNIDVVVRRIGGAYGSRISCANQPAVAAALGAYLLQRPVRTQMDIETNMRLVGKRFAHQAKYKVGFNNDGKIVAVQVEIISDCGYANSGMGSATSMYVDNTYNVPNWSITGKFVTTNKPPNTACRAPGALPGIAFMERIVDRVAIELGADPATVRTANFYVANDVTPTGAPLKYCSIGSLWAKLASSADVSARLAAVTSFNASSRWIKRGLAMTPVRYGIGWAGNNMATQIMVNATDGSVWVRSSGIESGQGLNVKVAAVVALELGIPMDLIKVLPASTSGTPNTGVTGGSIGSGECCAAALIAAKELNAALAPVKAMLTSAAAGAPPAWMALVSKANAAGVNLSAYGWLAPKPPAAGPFRYSSYGAAVAEVEVNALTGETQILRYDVLFDCGISLNPAIDVGQVEGATVMGIGNFVCEELVYDATTGALVTDSTWTYKPPSSRDIPIDMRVELLPDAPNPTGVLSSKASGEPPLTLTVSVFLALKNAIAAARADAGTTGFFAIDPPLTPAAIQQACLVSLKDLTF